MAEVKKEQPIIIKKIKKGGHGHHGGAWKVAYADFVTAMMAFFLLLWLLSSTSKATRDGLAEYFTPTIGLKDSKGIGFQGGSSPNSKEGIAHSDMTDPGLVAGQTPQGSEAQAPKDNQDQTSKEAEEQAAAKAKEDEGVEEKQKLEKKLKADAGNADQEIFDQAAKEISKVFQQDPELEKLKDNIIVTNTPEGLKIDLVDDAGQPMFAPGAAVMTEIGKKIMGRMGAIISKTPNQVAISGHTDATNFVGANGYDNWSLSADRANSARKQLQNTALGPARVGKVTGMADRDLLLPNEPNSPRNRRISIILLRGQYTQRTQAAPSTRSLISVPQVDSNAPTSPEPTPASPAEKPAEKK